MAVINGLDRLRYDNRRRVNWRHAIRAHKGKRIFDDKSTDRSAGVRNAASKRVR